MMYAQNSQEIHALVMQYFNGIYKGDISGLKSVFHPRALLFGDVNNQDYFKDIDQYFEGVKNRKSPSELDEPFQMKIISVEIINKVAIVKAHLPMLGFNYYDYLSIANVDSKWTIVNKLFTNVP
jgi:hypothetical protein